MAASLVWGRAWTVTFTHTAIVGVASGPQEAEEHEPYIDKSLLSTRCCMFGFAFIGLCVVTGSKGSNGPKTLTDFEHSVY